MDKAHFVYIADVFCPWCYAFAPIMQRISREHPQLPVHVVGGNLISQPITLAEDAASSPGLTDFWHEVEQTSGRSLQGAITAVETGKDVRLYSPGADEILTALRLFAPGHELEQLLELEDMFYGQGLDIFTDDNLASIARRWNIDSAKFEKVLDNQATLDGTEQSLTQASRLMGEITSYPSVLLVRGSQVDAVSRGYVHYETVRSRLEDAMADLGISPEESPHRSRYNGRTLNRHS